MYRVFIAFLAILRSIQSGIPSDDGRVHNISAVIFFASTDSIHTCQNVDHIAYLNISKVANIQVVIVGGPYPRTCNCKSTLTYSISSLVEWARDSLKMAVATISLAMNRGKGDFTFYSSRIQIMNKMDESSVGNDRLPNLVVLDKEKEGNDGDTVVINAYPPEQQINHIPKNLMNVRRAQRTVGLNPEHYQTFTLQTESDIGEDKKTASLGWSLSKLMSIVKNSLFQNAVTELVDFLESNEESGQNDLQEYVLLPSVSKTLRELRAQNNGRFLLVVNGGNLSMVSNPYSDLVQAIKHVRETTDCSRTLIVVTGDCSNSNDGNLPVFAIGKDPSK
ncbi:hypothetical protein RI129_009269 [Pyrocoelia pectoralis]|uniref:VWFA domain-containing protein n=1 Tax=Pyrocoelia pectoralis TaxID=417401 RepID=A0AAN7V489_9COLE